MAAREAVFLVLNCIFAEAKIRQRRRIPLVSVIHLCKKTTDSAEMKDLEQTSALSIAPFLAEVGSSKLIMLYKPGSIKWLTAWGTRETTDLQQSS